MSDYVQKVFWQKNIDVFPKVSQIWHTHNNFNFERDRLYNRPTLYMPLMDFVSGIYLIVFQKIYFLNFCQNTWPRTSTTTKAELWQQKSRSRRKLEVTVYEFHGSMMNLYSYVVIKFMALTSSLFLLLNDCKDARGFLVQRSIRGRATEMGRKISLLV